MDAIKDLRIYQHHRLSFNRGDEVFIHFEGKKLKAFTHEPVAVALFASGVQVTMRSFRFHRPRGMFCLNGKCASCLMRIDGVPNQKACKVLCADGMLVQRESAIPNASDDLLFVNDWIFPKGFDYHHMFTRPKWVNKQVETLFRRFSGTGSLPDSAPAELPRFRDQEADVAVIGAGPAGIEAALAAAEAKLDVFLVDDHHQPGGHLLHCAENLEPDLTGQTYSAEQVAALIDRGVTLANDTECIGFYDEGFFGCVNAENFIRLRAKRMIMATGAYDQNFQFAQNDLPNIFSARGLCKLTNLYGVCPGVRIFLIGSNDDVLSLARRLPEIGVQVVGIAEPGDRIQGNPEWAEEVQSRGVPVFLNFKVNKAQGRFKLKGIEIEPALGGEMIRTRCDLIAVGAMPSPSTELLAQAGVPLYLEMQKGGYVPKIDKYGRTEKEDIFAAGEITGTAPVLDLMKAGRIAGYAAALDLKTNKKIKEKLDKLL